eukprot:EST44875.1 Hypothetical protein SS50377_15214 [Spironucleus salmonicida]
MPCYLCLKPSPNESVHFQEELWYVAEEALGQNSFRLSYCRTPILRHVYFQGVPCIVIGACISIHAFRAAPWYLLKIPLKRQYHLCGEVSRCIGAQSLQNQDMQTLSVAECKLRQACSGYRSGSTTSQLLGIVAQLLQRSSCAQNVPACHDSQGEHYCLMQQYTSRRFLGCRFSRQQDPVLSHATRPHS